MSIKYIKGEQNTVGDALSRLEEIICPSTIDYNQLSIDQQQDQELKKLKQQENLLFREITIPGCNRTILLHASSQHYYLDRTYPQGTVTQPSRE